jgi:hypothetical protein
MPKKQCIIKTCLKSKILFIIPTKNEDFLKWKNACKDYVDLKRGMYLWSFHFAEEGIVRKRFITSAEGTFLGVVSSRVHLYDQMPNSLLLLLLSYFACGMDIAYLHVAALRSENRKYPSTCYA